MAMLQLSETTMERLREVAAQRRQSATEIVEDLIARHLQPDIETSPTLEETASDDENRAAVKEAWFGLVGLGSSDHTDTASRIREVMDELTYPHRTWSLKDTDEGTR